MNTDKAKTIAKKIAYSQTLNYVLIGAIGAVVTIKVARRFDFELVRPSKDSETGEIFFKTITGRIMRVKFPDA